MRVGESSSPLAIPRIVAGVFTGQKARRTADHSGRARGEYAQIPGNEVDWRTPTTPNYTCLRDIAQGPSVRRRELVRHGPQEPLRARRSRPSKQHGSANRLATLPRGAARKWYGVERSCRRPSPCAQIRSRFGLPHPRATPRFAGVGARPPASLGIGRFGRGRRPRRWNVGNLRLGHCYEHAATSSGHPWFTTVAPVVDRNSAWSADMIRIRVIRVFR